MTAPQNPLSYEPVRPKRPFTLPPAIVRIGWPLLALGVLLLINAVFTPNFFKITVGQDGRLFGLLIDILKNGSPIILLALGQALVISTGGVDLSVGAVMAISGCVAACLISQSEYSPLVGLPIPHGSVFSIVVVALVVAVVAGVWNGGLVVGLGLQPIIATLVLMVAGRGVAQLINGSQIITFDPTDPTGLASGFAALGRGSILGLPTPVVIAGVAAIVFGALTRLTALGLFLESSGNSPRAARMAGVPTRRVTLLAYAASGLCAGMAGLILTADVASAAPNSLGLYSELDAILAVSLGGTALAGGRFSLAGAIIGAILIQTLTTTILAQGIAREVTLVIKGLLVIAVCLMQSEAFRGSIKDVYRRLRPAGGVA